MGVVSETGAPLAELLSSPPPNGFNGKVIAHELGHAFGLQHDFRNDAYIMSYGGINRGRLSECAAEWLDVHRYFNTKQSSQGARNTTIQMFPPSLASPPNAIRFRFEVTDPDGLHQAQLLTPEKAPSSIFSAYCLQAINRHKQHPLSLSQLN